MWKEKSMSLPIAPADLQELLKTSAVTEIRSLEMERIGNQIILRGVVCSFYYKQLAQELVRNAVAGLEIENQISVEYDKGMVRDVVHD
jgi:hypothetical protein